MASYKVGILGATGAVGEQMRIVLAERKFPISELRLFGSARSAGKVINYEGQDIVVPVSYTHLDVYKRQAFGPCKRSLRVSAKEML